MNKGVPGILLWSKATRSERVRMTRAGARGVDGGEKADWV